MKIIYGYFWKNALTPICTSTAEHTGGEDSEERPPSRLNQNRALHFDWRTWTQTGNMDKMEANAVLEIESYKPKEGLDFETLLWMFWTTLLEPFL